MMARAMVLVVVAACSDAPAGVLAPLLTSPSPAPATASASTTSAQPEDIEPVIAPALPLPAVPVFDVPPPQDRVVGLARDEHHACVVRASGAVDCWGQHRRCNQYSCDTDFPSDPTIRRVPGIDDAIAIEPTARCVLRRSGKVACLEDDRFEMTELPGLENARVLASGAECAILATGTVVCKADDEWKPVPGVRDAKSLTYMEFRLCVTRNAGGVACGSRDGVTMVSQTATDAITGRHEFYRGSVVWTCLREQQGYRCSGELEGEDPAYTDEALRTVPDLSAFARSTQLVNGDNAIVGIVDGRVLVHDGGRSVQELPVLTDAVAVVNGCALRATGAVVCWGKNDTGALAQPTTIARTDVPPTIVPGLANVRALALGASTSWALTRDHRVFGWGFREGKRVTAPVELPLGEAGGTLEQIGSTRFGQPCVRHASGRVWCKPYQREWSLFEQEHVRALDEEASMFVAGHAMRTPELHRQSGMSTHPHDHFVAKDSPGHGDAIGKAAGCALTHAGRVRCGATVLAFENVSKLVGAGPHACAIHGRRLSCWRPPSHTDTGTSPRSVEGIDEAFDVAVTATRVCAVHDGGRVSCASFEKPIYSDNKFSGGGGTERAEQIIPRDAIGPALDVELGDATAVARDYADSPKQSPYGCAILVDRRVVCWGGNAQGALGDGSVLASDSPVGVRL